jgi:hypothetical protein
MKRIPIEMIVVLLLLGVVIGIAWSSWAAMEAQMTNHNARLLVIESDQAKRVQVKAFAGVVVGIVSKLLHKLTFGLIK